MCALNSATFSRLAQVRLNRSLTQPIERMGATMCLIMADVERQVLSSCDSECCVCQTAKVDGHPVTMCLLSRDLK
jgi:hypothetical protein